MKKICSLFLLMFCVLMVKAQRTGLASPDAAKIMSTTHASPVLHASFLGSSNTQSADLIWKPVLGAKYIEIDNESPNQDFVDSIKSEKLKQKNDYELKHPHKNIEKSTLVSPVAGTNFLGNGNSGYSPLDNSIAISDSGVIVSVTNNVIACYDTDGSNTFYKSLLTFLNDTTGISNVCDPVVIYDSGHDRFIFFCQQSPLVKGGRIFICFSKNNNPLDGWWIYSVKGDTTITGDAFDYPKLAINDSELFITGNLFSEPNSNFHQAVIFQMDKLSGFAGDTLNYVTYTAIPGSPFTLLPVSLGQSGNITTGMLLVSTDYSGASDINLYQITGNWCCGPVINYWSVPTTYYSLAADAMQLNTTCKLKINDCRALSGFYLNGIIHFVFQSDFGSGYSGINYNRLNVAALTNQSLLTGSLGNDLAYPSIASYATDTADKSVMIGFGLSSSSSFPQIGVISCDDTGGWSDYTILQNSASYVSYTSPFSERWGDYTGMARMNHSALTVWMSGMFGDPAHKWQTWIDEIESVPVTGIHELRKAISSKVYPNPIVHSFNVEFQLNESCSLDISVVDNNGRMVKDLYQGKGTAGDNVFSFDKSNLASGIYFLTIKANSTTIKNEKIIISN